jgi:hypothetical protein
MGAQDRPPSDQGAKERRMRQSLFSSEWEVQNFPVATSRRSNHGLIDDFTRRPLGPPPSRLFYKMWDPKIHQISPPTSDGEEGCHHRQVRGCYPGILVLWTQLRTHEEDLCGRHPMSSGSKNDPLGPAHHRWASLGHEPTDPPTDRCRPRITVAWRGWSGCRFRPLKRHPGGSVAARICPAMSRP